MTTPQQFTAKLQDKIDLNDKYVKYSFELIEPNKMEFLAGQYISIKVNENGSRRSYSICSSPKVDHGFELLVDIEPNGVGVSYLQSLNFGDEISFLGPMGIFVVDEKQTDELVFVATGSGIAPFHSMVLDLLQNKGEQRKITLYWGMRYSKQIFWLDEFKELMDNFSQFNFHPVLSKAEPGWTLCHGRVTDCLMVHGFPANGDYYLCGSKAMIEESGEILKKSGISKEKIHFEKFW
ncbi:MAG: FAD-binding oxidoreductase [Patescibacteria group bacterium]